MTDHQLTFEFKTCEPDLILSLDVYLPSKSVDHPIPILFWFHGGGLLMGSRSSLKHHQRRSAEKYGLAVVCPDYRLAPQVTLDEVLKDCEDAVLWTLKNLQDRLGSAYSLDTSRYAFSGSSAGGYLTLLLGSFENLSPKSLICLYPITNPFGPFFSTPQPNFKYSQSDNRDMEQHVNLKGKILGEYKNPNRQVDKKDRWNIYAWMVQEGNLAQLLRAQEDHHVPMNKLSKDFTPTYITHGTADVWVGIEQSRSIVQKMRQIGVKHVYEEVEGQDHEFDDPESNEMEGMYSFLLSHW